ncbi:MAG: hypothetical protein ACO4AL_11005 [Steroidobacteraceae bacterium]
MSAFDLFTVPDGHAEAWSRLLKDDNPIHGAEGGAVQPGPANLAYLISAVMERFPGSRVLKLQARFLSPLIAPCEASVTCEVLESRASGDGERLTLQATLLSGGEPRTRMEATLWRPAA